MFKKPKLKFECLIPEVAEQMPIVPAGKVQYQWAKKMIENMRKESAECPINAQHTHIAKCPGIALVARHGWVQKSYMDIAFNDVELKLMSNIKKVFDPKNMKPLDEIPNVVY